MTRRDMLKKCSEQAFTPVFGSDVFARSLMQRVTMLELMKGRVSG